MHTSKRMTIAYLAMAAALLALFALNLFWGSIALSPADIAAALLGRCTNALAADILLQLRLPRAVMVVLLGAALSGICCKRFLPTRLPDRSSWAFPAGPSWLWR